jgi:hypothetical protein
MRRWIFIAVVVAVAIIIAIALLIWLLPLWLLITLAILLALFLLFLPIQIAVQTRQHGLEATVWVQLKLPLLKFSKAINITDKLRQALQKALKQWRKRRRKQGHAASAAPPAQGPLGKHLLAGPPQPKPPQPKPLQPKRPPPPPFRPVMHAVRQPMRYFARHIRFSQCRLRAEIGGFDAMQSALLAGALWSVVGTALGVASTLIRLEPGVSKIAIVPNFSGPTWRLQTDCILHFRLGHAIVAGVWALVRLLREKELVRWWQQGRRRKGVEGSG